MPRPRLLLVPEFTELSWTPIRSQLDEWADIAFFDPPGVGEEPQRDLSAGFVSRELKGQIVERGLQELDRRGWTRFFVVADGWAIHEAVRIAGARRDAVAGLVLGHARLSHRRQGDRAPINGEVWAGLTQLLKQDHEEFLRYAIVQTSRGGVDEELAAEMVARFPQEWIEAGWETLTREEEFEAELRELELPLLLAKHEGCLMSTAEGYEEAAAAFPDARTITTSTACASDPAFAAAAREFCEQAVAVEGA